MKTSYAFLGFVLLSLSMGCRYRGAIYSEYEQLALDVRASTTDANGPVKVNFGYDRGVIAFVPHRVNAGTNTSVGARGEAVSLISWSKTGTRVVPPQISGDTTNKVLGVNAGLITGTAALVASVPEGVEVTIVSDSSSTNYVGTTRGSRVAAAAAVTIPGFRDVLQRAALVIWGREGDSAAVRKQRAEDVLRDVQFEDNGRDDLVNRLSDAKSVTDMRKLLMRARDQIGTIRGNLDPLNRR